MNITYLNSTHFNLPTINYLLFSFVLITLFLILIGILILFIHFADNHGETSRAQDVNHGHANMMWKWMTRRYCKHIWTDYPESIPCDFAVAAGDPSCSQTKDMKICGLCRKIRCRTHAATHYPINNGTSIFRSPSPPKPKNTPNSSCYYIIYDI